MAVKLAFCKRLLFGRSGPERGSWSCLTLFSLLEYPDYPNAPEYKERMDLPKPSDMVFRIRMSVEAGDISEKLLLCYPVRMLESVFKPG